MSNEKFCPVHKDRPLREFTAGEKAKNPGMKYWKCTLKEYGKFCEYVEWPEKDFSYTKKFTQLPSGEVLESEEPWGEEEQTGSDIRTILARIESKVDSLKKLLVNEVL